MSRFRETEVNLEKVGVIGGKVTVSFRLMLVNLIFNLGLGKCHFLTNGLLISNLGHLRRDDWNYAAPVLRNPRDKEPAYHNLTPVINQKIAEDIYKRTMQTSVITLT
jgi:hypothetical protein